MLQKSGRFSGYGKIFKKPKRKAAFSRKSRRIRKASQAES
jgi:hypothetical protein